MPRSGKLIHYRVNPERVPAVCAICDRRWMAPASRLRARSVQTCGQVCKALAMTLFPLVDRRRYLGVT